MTFLDEKLKCKLYGFSNLTLGAGTDGMQGINALSDLRFYVDRTSQVVILPWDNQTVVVRASSAFLFVPQKDSIMFFDGSGQAESYAV